YCRQDTLIVERAMEWLMGIVSEGDLGGMAQTLPSLGMRAFRHRFMPHPPTIHNYEPVLLLERAAYHGGRCEAWHLGPVAAEVFKVDVNSLYPSQMANKLHPVKLKKLYPEGSLELLLEHARYDFVIAAVTGGLTEPLVPLRKDKLLFPVGRFKTVLPSHELDLV